MVFDNIRDPEIAITLRPLIMWSVVYNTVADHLYYTLIIDQYFALKCVLLKTINLFKKSSYHYHGRQ